MKSSRVYTSVIYLSTIYDNSLDFVISWGARVGLGRDPTYSKNKLGVHLAMLTLLTNLDRGSVECYCGEQ
jgi:hypothetical protein